MASMNELIDECQRMAESLKRQLEHDVDTMRHGVAGDFYEAYCKEMAEEIRLIERGSTNLREYNRL